MSEAWMQVMSSCREASASGDHLLAASRAREAQAIARQERRTDLAIEALHQHAIIRADLGQTEEAVDSLEEALLVAQRTDTPDAVTGELYLLAGRFLARLDRLSDAIDHLERALYHLALPEKRLETFTRLALVAERAGWFHVALTAQQERVSLSLSLYDLEDPRTLQAIVGLGEVYRIQGLLADARTILDIVVSAVGDLPERTDAQTAALASALHNLGLVFAASDPGNAREVLHEALAHLEQVVGPDHPAVSRTHMALGLLDRDQGREQEARSHWEIALKPLPEDDPLHHRLEALLAVTA